MKKLFLLTWLFISCKEEAPLKDQYEVSQGKTELESMQLDDIYDLQLTSYTGGGLQSAGITVMWHDNMLRVVYQYEGMKKDTVFIPRHPKYDTTYRLTKWYKEWKQANK